MMKCLIVDKMHDSTKQLFNEAGVACTYRPEITRAEIIDLLVDYDGLVIRSKTTVDEELLTNARNLKFVGRAGAGVDNLDEDFLKARNIKILNAPEGNRNAVAEQATGMLLALLHNVVRSDDEVRKLQWLREENRGVELAGKTVGLMGYGYMGKAFARKLFAFDCEVIAYDKYKQNFSDKYCKQVSLEELHNKSDIFSIHVPLTEETQFMVDLPFLEKFKKNIYLINTARGEILSLKGCCSALKSGKLIGAALDVLENEKLEGLSESQRNSVTYLVNSPRTILTPHVAGWSHESYKSISEVLACKIKALINEKD